MPVVPREKRFLGAALAVAKLGMGIYNMIDQNNAQKKAVEEQNKAIEEQNALQLNQRLESDNISQRNFGNNSNMKSFYANGGRNVSGVKQVTPTEAIAYGATHNERNPNQGGTGVPYRNIEVEGGGKNGNQPGEVIKQNPDGDFIFSDRILYDDKHTFAQVAQGIVQQKGIMQQNLQVIRSAMDTVNNAISKAGSAVKSSTYSRELEKLKTKNNEANQNLQMLEQQLQGLQQAQLQKGIQMGIYNEDGTPKNTETPPPDGQTIEDQQPQNEQQMAYGGKPKFIAGGIDKFLSGNEGQGVMGLANAGLNLISNINTAKNMSKLKVPKHAALKSIDTGKVNYSADRQNIKDSIVDTSKFAEQNYANPNVALAMKQRAITAGLKQESELNQQEQNVNTQIEAQNAQRRLQTEQINDQNFVQDQMMQLNKDQQDINNRQNITAGLTKDLGNVITNYQKGVMEDRTLRTYGRLSADGVADRTELVGKYDVNLNVMDDMSNPNELESYLSNKGVPYELIKYYKQKLETSQNLNLNPIINKNLGFNIPKYNIQLPQLKIN